MAVDAWAKSNGGAPAARRAEALLERMDRLYREGGGRHEALKPTTGIFNAVINVSWNAPCIKVYCPVLLPLFRVKNNGVVFCLTIIIQLKLYRRLYQAWARSREKIAPQRAEQILSWMETLRDKGGEDLDISPDKYTFNTVIHAYAKSGAKESATKAHRILDNMNQMYREGNSSVKPDTITVSRCLACCIRETARLVLIICLSSHTVQRRNQRVRQIWWEGRSPGGGEPPPENAHDVRSGRSLG